MRRLTVESECRWCGEPGTLTVELLDVPGQLLPEVEFIRDEATVAHWRSHAADQEQLLHTR